MWEFLTLCNKMNGSKLQNTSPLLLSFSWKYYLHVFLDFHNVEQLFEIATPHYENLKKNVDQLIRKKI